MNESAENSKMVRLLPCQVRTLSRWIKAGRPVRTPDEIRNIYEICKQCKAFDAVAKSCKYCRCRVNDHGNPLLNVIAIATERCPVGAWLSGH